MAYYLIVAQEDMYHGGHGIEDWTIEDCAGVHEAFALGHEMSLDLIDSYSEFYNLFKENAEYWADQEEEDRGEIFTEEEREEYITNAIEEQREDDVYYMCWKLSDKFDYSSLNKEDIDWRDVADIYGEEEY